MVKQMTIVITAFAILVFAYPASAQQAGKVHRIGYLTTRSSDMEKSYFPAFQKGLRELGYVEGKNIVIEARHANRNNKRLPALAAELLRGKLDVIVIGGGASALAVQRLSKTIPIVMAEATAPVKRGIVTNFARPGGNITGLARRAPEEFGKYLELLKETVPGLTRMAVLWNPKGPASKLGWELVQHPAQMLGIQLHSMEVRGTDDLEKAFREAREASVEALYVTPGPRVDQKMLAELILRNRLPSLATGALLVKRAALISYGSSMAHHYRRAAYYVDKILKGAKPRDLPVELATVFNLVVNMRTAKALGIKIPPTILLRATQVIE